MDVFLDEAQEFDTGSLPPEIFCRILNQVIRNRRAGGNAHARDTGKPVRIDLAAIVDQIS